MTSELVWMLALFRLPDNTDAGRSPGRGGPRRRRWEWRQVPVIKFIWLLPVGSALLVNRAPRLITRAGWIFWASCWPGVDWHRSSLSSGSTRWGPPGRRAFLCLLTRHFPGWFWVHQGTEAAEPRRRSVGVWACLMRQQSGARPPRPRSRQRRRRQSLSRLQRPSPPR